MAKRILIAVLLVPVLSLTGLGPATAKDAITRLRLCGASTCITVLDMTTLQILMTYIVPSTARHPAPAPYFTFAPIPTRQWPSSYPRYVYVPSAKLVRIRYPPSRATWGTVGDAAPMLQHLTAGMRAYVTPSAWQAVTVTARATSSIHPETGLATASCADAIYTTPAPHPPEPVQAVRIGPAVFNSLANLTSARGIDKPSKSLPFYTVKSPLTILARSGHGVIITLIGEASNAAFVYLPFWLHRLTAWHYTFSQVPRRIQLPLCRDTQTKLPLNTQYAGGLLLRKLGCVTIQVQVIGETRTYRARIPIGVRRC